MRYSAKPSTAMSLRLDHNTWSGKIGSIPVNSTVQGEEVWIAAQTSATAAIGDKWLRVKMIDGIPADGWVAIIHLGHVYCTLTDAGVEVPPPSDGIVRIVQAVVTAEMSDGTQKDFTLLPQ